jgi:DNA primase
MDTIADAIKRALSMDAVARYYGFHPNRSGNILCPFHHEKTASLKIYTEPGRGFHCYGCGEGGSVIDFVMKLLSIPYSAALVRLNADFHLGLTNEKPDPKELARLHRERREAEERRRAFEAEYEIRTNQFRRLWAAKVHKAPQSPGDEFDPEYVEACKTLDALDWWFQEHPFNPH